MEPSSNIDYIEKISGELSELQEKYNALERDPVVIYINEEELENTKKELYGQLKKDINNIDYDFLHPLLSIAIEEVLSKLIKDDEKKNNWSYIKSFDLQIYIESTIKPLEKCLTPNRIYEIIYEIITNYIDNILWNESGDGIVKYKCNECGELGNYSTPPCFCMEP